MTAQHEQIIARRIFREAVLTAMDEHLANDRATRTEIAHKTTDVEGCRRGELRPMFGEEN